MEINKINQINRLNLRRRRNDPKNMNYYNKEESYMNNRKQDNKREISLKKFKY